MNRALEGSTCSAAAESLSLSLWGTLALRVTLMILTRITFGNSDRSLVVTIGSSSASIRVSRTRRSTSSRTRKTACLDELLSGSTATMHASIVPLQADALSSDAQDDLQSIAGSSETASQPWRLSDEEVRSLEEHALLYEGECDPAAVRDAVLSSEDDAISQRQQLMYRYGAI